MNKPWWEIPGNPDTLPFDVDEWQSEMAADPRAAAKRAKRAKRPQTPHAALKHKARAAITEWRQRTGFSILLLPSIVGQVRVDDGTRGGKNISVGRKGQSDDTILVGKDGVLWGVICAEYKAGSDYQKHAQQTFEDKATRVGALYVIVRSAAQMTDALDQIAAQRGRGPFG